jgi:hypothetical protein
MGKMIFVIAATCLKDGRMTPEEMGNFTETAYLLGSAVAEAEWTTHIPVKEHREASRKAWATFYRKFVTDENLGRIATNHFWDGYDDAKKRISQNRRN